MMRGRGQHRRDGSAVGAVALVSAGALAVSSLLSLQAGSVASAAAATAQAGTTAVGTATLSATVETVPVPHAGDAADDPAIWINPADPSHSAVIGTDKQGALLVYDLAGQQVQSQAVGDINNVDVRSDLGDGRAFPLGGRAISLVTATNRTSNSILVDELDPATRELHDVAARVITVGVEAYGTCMYRSPQTGSFYVFITSKAGQLEQWELRDNGAARWTAPWSGLSR
jgi:3-phytase